MEPTTLYPDGLVGPIDANTPVPPTIFAKPARALDVQVDYQFAASDGAKATGSYAIDAVVSGDAGWSTTLPLVERTPLDDGATRAETSVDLGMLAGLVEQITDEAGVPSMRYDVAITPRFDVRADVAGSRVEEQYAPKLSLTYTGANWTVAPELHAEQTHPLGAEVTRTVQLAGVDVSLLRLAFVPALALLLFAALLVALAIRRVPRLTVDALLRRPGIAVIDLEQPPADADLAVPLSSAEGIRRVAERDGGLVLRYEHDGDMLLYARHDDRVYCYTVETADR
jgi:hypothetical protein